MNLPSEKVVALKQLIQSHLNKNDVHSKLRSLLIESTEAIPTDVDELSRHVQQILQQNNVIDPIMEEVLQQIDMNVANEDRSNTKLITGMLEQVKKEGIQGSHLYLQVLQGRAFLNSWTQEALPPGQPTSYFRLFVHFRGQRFASHLTPCICEPEFNEGFLLELPTTQKDGLMEKTALMHLLSSNCPIHLVLIRIDPMNFCSLVASYFLEWRSVLAVPDHRMKLAVEMYGVGAESQVPAGVLEIQVELIPTLDEYVGPEAVTSQINAEHTRRAEQERLFLVYAKNWWKEYLEIRPSHERRFVKIFAQDESGITHPVCQYVAPLKAGRLLETPREAAWFVSLVPYEPVSTIGGASASKMERWALGFTFLCLNKGDCEEHAVLLCSLLLGFGLEAYVCIGSKKKADPYAWVLTLGPKGEVAFWDPLTAERFSHKPIRPDDPPVVPQPKPSHSFTKIGCLFNHKAFYANSQPSDSILTCLFDVENDSLWKPMAADSLQAIASLNRWNSVRFPPLIVNPLDAALASGDLEQELRALVVEYRRDLGLTTTWDGQLSYLLGLALASYELEKKTGLSVNQEDFQHAIRYAIPSGHTFKGFPIRFSHNHARRIFTSCLRSQIFQDILEGRGDIVRHALHVRIYAYPERVMSSWIMLAVKYKSVL